MITYDQALTESEFHREGGCHRVVGPKGGVRETVERWRRNGQTKVWKTRPDEWAVPIKWGMRSYDTLTHREANLIHVASECPLNDPEWEG